jgi:hypothetical protein
MYRGLAPHKIMPMPGTHKAINSDRKKHRFALLFASGYGCRYAQQKSTPFILATTPLLVVAIGFWLKAISVSPFKVS